MSFIRPELKDAIWRWRESLIGLAIACFGLWAVIGSSGVAEMLGYTFAVAGAVLTFAGIQRARFRIGSGGPGLVEITEGQVTYFGPTDGGTIAVEQIAMVELDPAARPHAQWILTENGQPPLAIPTTAEGADGLFDVFARLDGIETEQMLAELEKAPDKRVVIWKSSRPLSAAIAIPSALH